MNQFLRVTAGPCTIVIDCRYVHEVDRWQDAGESHKHVLWQEHTLPAVSLAELLAQQDQSVTAAVILRDPDGQRPRMLLGVSQIEGLMDLTDSGFVPVLDSARQHPLVSDAAFDAGRNTVLLRLEVARLLVETGVYVDASSGQQLTDPCQPLRQEDF